MSDEPPVEMVDRCLAAMARVNAAQDCATALQGFVAQGRASETEAEVAFAVLTAELLAIVLRRGGLQTVNHVLNHGTGSRWRVTALDG